MTTILFNLVLLALALDLIIWGIDQGWVLVNRYHKEINKWGHCNLEGDDNDGHA